MKSVLTSVTRIINYSFRRRSCFFAESRFLLSRRRSIAPRLGRVFLRGAGGGAEASLSFSTNCSTHKTLFRHWLRLVWQVMVISSSNEASRRARIVSEQEMSASAIVSDALVEFLLTFCPPAPDDREKVHTIASAFTRTPRAARRSSSGVTSPLCVRRGLMLSQCRKTTCQKP